MMREKYSCASCHGNDGSGGVHFMHMELMSAPNITYNALNNSLGQDQGHDDDHAHDAGDYGIEDFRQAVVFGKHPDGEALNSDMPRWDIETADLNQLFLFIRTLQ